MQPLRLRLVTVLAGAATVAVGLVAVLSAAPAHAAADLSTGNGGATVQAWSYPHPGGPLTLEGLGSAGGHITVSEHDTDTVLATTTVLDNGTWTATTTDISASEHLLDIEQLARGAFFSSTTFQVGDGAAPAAPSVRPTTGDIVRGTAEPGSRVRVLDPSGDVVGEGPAGDDGVFVVDLDPQQAGGTILSVTATDAAGNVSAPTSTAVVVLDHPRPVDLVVSYRVTKVAALDRS